MKAAFLNSLDLGGGLRLEPVTQADIPEVFRTIVANREGLRKWLPWVDQTHQESDTFAWFEKLAEAREKGDEGVYLLRHEGKFVGVIGVHTVDRSNQATSLGYWLVPEAEGAGFMTRACRAVLALLFENLNLERVEIRAATENLRSQAIPLRLGFRPEGVLRHAQALPGGYVDLAVFGILRDEWLSQNVQGSLKFAE